MQEHKLVAVVNEVLPSSKLLYLFGSQANGTSNTQSDIDLAVLLPEKLDPVQRFECQEQLAIHLGKDVDLVDLLSASTVLQHQVIHHGKLLWGAEAEQCQFEMQVMSMHQHLNDERAEILKDYQ